MRRPPTTTFGLSLAKPPRRISWARWARVLWASPNSLVGLFLALGFMLAGARLRRVDGVLEVALNQHPPAGGKTRPASRWRLPFTAITFGHVVLGVSPQDLERLRAHEHTHVRQCERWGPLFLPAYLLAGAWQWARGRHAYRDNPFEVEARRIGGG
ncbi:MAG: signal peptide prediction [Hydrogenophaga sp.]|nr:signal peptide prediction [Hydrogenophaga sp.]